MKTQLTLLLVSTFVISSMSFSTAQPLTPNEIFAAIDGESENVEGLLFRRSVQPRANPRINYELTHFSSSDLPMRRQTESSTISSTVDSENVNRNWIWDDFHQEEDYDDE